MKLPIGAKGGDIRCTSQSWGEPRCAAVLNFKTPSHQIQARTLTGGDSDRSFSRWKCEVPVIQLIFLCVNVSDLVFRSYFVSSRRKDYLEVILCSVRKTPPLAVVCVSLPSARPPPSPSSPLPTCSATHDLQVVSPANKQTNKHKMWLFRWKQSCGDFYTFGSSQHTFCSSAVISCSAFTSLNFRSLICLFESPAKVQPQKKHSWLVGHIQQWNTTASRTRCARLLTLDFYNVRIGTIFEDFTVGVWTVLRAVPLGLLFQLGLELLHLQTQSQHVSGFVSPYFISRVIIMYFFLPSAKRFWRSSCTSLWGW